MAWDLRKSPWKLMLSRFAQFKDLVLFLLRMKFHTLNLKWGKGPKWKQISAQKINTLLAMDKTIFQARCYTTHKFYMHLVNIAHQSSLFSPPTWQLSAHQHSHDPCFRSNLKNFLLRNTSPKLISQVSHQDVSRPLETLTLRFCHRLEWRFVPLLFVTE